MLNELFYIEKNTKIEEVHPFIAEELIKCFKQLNIYNGCLISTYAYWTVIKGCYQPNLINPHRIRLLLKDIDALNKVPSTYRQVLWTKPNAKLSWNLFVKDSGISDIDNTAKPIVKRNIFNLAQELSILIDVCPYNIEILRWYSPYTINRETGYIESSRYISGDTVDITVVKKEIAHQSNLNKLMWQWLKQGYNGIGLWSDKAMGIERDNRYIRLELRFEPIHYLIK